MDLEIKGKKAFITGSTSGIGFDTARILLEEGAEVYINGRTSSSVNEALQKLKSAIPHASVFGIVADFKSTDAVKQCIRILPKTDILINNVGIYSSKSFFETDSSTWLEQFQVNLMSGVELAQHYLKGMLEQNEGRMVFISSECAYLVPQDMISYSSTKVAIHALSKGLSQLTKGTAVTVNVVVPGSTLSEGAKQFLKEKAEVENSTAEKVEAHFFRNERTTSLLQRFAGTKEIGSTIAYLCSPLASATNGSIVKVDGGSTGGVF
ncbi:MAG: SDR family NAD(P)-dependent oxidoreductase [Flavobacteriaceae bacterium]